LLVLYKIVNKSGGAEVKGFINANFGKTFFDNYHFIENNLEVKEELDRVIEDLNRDNYLEISYNFSKNYNYFLTKFKKGYFLSDDSFYAALVYHYSQKDNKDIDVYNYSFNKKSFDKLNLYEGVELVFSSFGITYQNLFDNFDLIANLLKVGGIIFLELPSYWFFRDELNEDEKAILNYSKVSDKRWLFTEDISPIIEENNCEIITQKRVNNQKILDRLDISYLSSLDKLHKASIENNIAVLEICDIKERELKINSSILVIKKKSKSINKDNLFSV